MYLRVKICGVTCIADARQAARLGADAIGLNFYPRSKRCINDETAAEIGSALPPFVETVGVYVNQPPAAALSHARRLGLTAVQWHGDEPALPPEAVCRFIPAFPIRDADDLARVRHYLAQCSGIGRMPAAILVDAHVPGEYGGTGRVAPWGLLAEFRPEVPLILAGGLTPDNVAEAARLVRPYAVDVAGGVESAPGMKDAEKMRRFIEQAREAAAAI
jgi:phosphoribosylanthranilate isomerase